MKNIIITTTNSIENYTIKKYLGIINANIVIGTNIFSDFAASFTDFFGGKSDTYQNKLNLIYKEVMNEIKSKATALNADAILGLHIDFDEISGKEKSMFMVSASGTAVLLEDKIEDRYAIYKLLENIHSYHEKGFLTDEEYQYEKERIINENKSSISKEISIIKEQEKKQQQEIEIFKDKIEKAKSLLEHRCECSEEYIKSIDIYQVNAVSYDDISYNSFDSMQNIIAKFLRLNRVQEACKFYMDETGLEDVEAAKDFILSIYNQIQNGNEEILLKLIPKLKVLKKRGFLDQAINEYQKITLCDKESAEAFIQSIAIDD